MKKLLTMLFTMTIVIGLTAQNNGFNFKKTNDYSKSNNYSKTYTYKNKQGQIIQFNSTEICKLLNFLTEEECQLFTNSQPSGIDNEKPPAGLIVYIQNQFNCSEEDAIVFLNLGATNSFSDASQKGGFNEQKKKLLKQ